MKRPRHDDDDEGKKTSTHPTLPRQSPSLTTPKQPVFLDPAYPKYLGYLPTPAAINGQDSKGRKVQEVDRVDARTLTPETFFRSYIARRRPCVLCNVLPAAALVVKEGESGGSFPDDLLASPGWLLRELLNHPLVSGGGGGMAPAFQVERRASDAAPFGQDRTSTAQVERTLQELVWDPCRELFYLSTQQGHADDGGCSDDAGQEEKDESTKPRRSPAGSSDCPDACAAISTLSARKAAAASSLVDAIRSTRLGPCLDLLRRLAGSLLLESKHGWLGFAPHIEEPSSKPSSGPSSSCSGLHHDYHDNFNFQLVGSKYWTLHPPLDYPHVPLYGTVQGVHGFNGLLSYRDNPTRADGVPLSVLLRDDSENDDDEEKDEEKGEENRFGLSIFSRDGAGDGDDEEEEDENLAVTSAMDDESNNDVGTAARSEDQTKSAEEAQGGASSSRRRRPSNFSPVDMTLPVPERNRQFPGYAPRFELSAHVRAGEALYLPASWFHCVWSSASPVAVALSDMFDVNDEDKATAEEELRTGSVGSASSGRLRYHLAVNFWYHPPDQDNFHQPYRHDYWAKQRKSPRDGSWLS
jgi:hypothetical protein